MSAISFIGNMIAPGGAPASGCKLTSTLQGTSTPSPLYSDVGLATPTTNPLVADADGRLEFYFDDSIDYSWSVTTADGATVLWQADVVGGVLTATYTNGTLIHSAWRTPLANALGSGWASALALAVAAGLGGVLGGGLTVATNAALAALTSASGLVDGGVYATRGGTSRRDGREGPWMFIEGDTATEDGRTVIADDADTGRFHRLAKYRQTQETWYYVNHGGAFTDDDDNDWGAGSDSNAGYTRDAPFANVTFCYRFLRDWVHAGGKKTGIQIAGRTFDEFIVCHGQVEGLQAATSGAGIAPESANGVIIRGDLNTEDGCFNQRNAATPCFSFAHWARCRVEGIKYENPGATDNAFKVYAHARVEVGQVVIGECGTGLIATMQCGDAGTLNAVPSADSAGWVKWDGNAGIGVVVEVGTGVLGLSDVRFGSSVTFSGHPASAFVNVGEGAYADVAAVYDGTFTGRKYWISDSAVISDTGTNNIEDIPGSEPGVRTSSTVSAPGTRLTLTNGTPVTEIDVTAATTIHLEPRADKYVLVRYSVSSGLMRQTIPASGISLALDGTNYPANSNFDLFTYALGTGEAVLATSPAWTNATTRSAAISAVDGTYVNTSTVTLRYNTGGGSQTVEAAAGTACYVGTFRTAGTNGQTEDSLARRFLWNNYQRAPRDQRVLEATATWPYSSGSWRAANDSAANRLAFVRGLAEDAVKAEASGYASNSTTTPRPVRIGIGLDTTAGFSPGCLPGEAAVTSAAFDQLRTTYRGTPGIGYHFLSWNENGNGSDTQTWRGNAGVSSLVQAGITGEVMA